MFKALSWSLLLLFGEVGGVQDMRKMPLDQEKDNNQDQDQVQDLDLDQDQTQDQTQDQEKDQEQDLDQEQDKDQDQENSRSRRHLLPLEDGFDQRELRSLLSSLGPNIKVIMT